MDAGEEYERYVSALLVEGDSVKRLLNDLSSNCCTIRAHQINEEIPRAHLRLNNEEIDAPLRGVQL